MLIEAGVLHLELTRMPAKARISPRRRVPKPIASQRRPQKGTAHEFNRVA
jgi:hypothetical protein